MREKEIIFMGMLKKIVDFITVGIWRIRLKDLSKSKSITIKIIRILLLSMKGFDESKCGMWASALTYFTLLAIVPAAAMAFGIAQGFGFEALLTRELYANFPGQEILIEKLILSAHSVLENTHGGLIAGVGIFLLIWVIIKVLNNLENAFNDIWGIQRGRPMHHKFSYYITVIFFFPILVITYSSLTVYIKTQINAISAVFGLPSMALPFFMFLLKITPLLILWILFSMMFILIPNTKVRPLSGIIAGFFSGIIYAVIQWLYIMFQISAVKYNALYGGFAALPLLLLWIYTSWMAVFFGAELSFAHQNVDMFEFDQDALKTSAHFRNILTLRITHLVIRNFLNEKIPLTAVEIGDALGMPIRLVRELLFDLSECGIVSEVARQENKETAYQPAKPLNVLSIHYVITALSKKGIDNIPVTKTRAAEQISASLDAFNETLQKATENILLKDL